MPPASAMTLTSALPTTAASAHRPTSRTCSGFRDAEAKGDRQVGDAPDAPHHLLRAVGERVARAGHAESRDGVQKAAPKSAACRSRSSVVVGLSRRIVSIPRAASMRAELARLLDRQVEDEHAVDPGLARPVRETLRRRGAGSGSRS